jgi:hypothetical protein
MNKTESYDCGECDKKYKSLKTLERHMIKMHSIEEVVPEIEIPDNKSETILKVEFDFSKKKAGRLVETMDVEKEAKKEGSTKTILDMPVHACATCVKCKFKIEYMEALLTILISRYNNYEKKVDILMRDYSKRKFVMEYNEQNPDNPITENDVGFKSDSEEK